MYQTINGKLNYKQGEREYENREMIKRNKIAKKFQRTGTKPCRKTSTIQKNHKRNVNKVPQRHAACFKKKPHTQTRNKSLNRKYSFRL